jgi:hypothetical protein
MSDCYRDCRSWQPRHHLTQASKGADADADSKHRGMFAAVDHYMQQAAQRAEQATLEQREQKAVQALDALQLTLGRMVGCKQNGGRLSVGKTVCGLRAVHSLWCQVRNDEPRAAGVPQPYDGRCGKIQLPKGAATPVPELTELTMQQLVMVVTQADLWHASSAPELVVRQLAACCQGSE